VVGRPKSIGYQNQLVDEHGVAADKSSARLLRKGYYAWRRGAAFRAEMLRSMPSLKRSNATQTAARPGADR
jgi:hypothetical protein